MLWDVFTLKGNIAINKNKDDFPMFLGDSSMFKHNHNGGKVDILLVSIVVLKLIPIYLRLDGLLGLNEDFIFT